MCKNSCGINAHECHTCGESHKAWRQTAFQAFSAAMLAGGIAAQASEWLRFSPAVAFAWFAAAWLPVALPVLKEAFDSIRKKDFFNEFSLMLIASIGAFAIGEYPEGVAVMLFYSIGEALQDKAVARARRNISALVDMRPKEATVVRGGKAESVPPESIAVGEEIIVKTGERVPLDGVLLDRDAVFDTAALTGESMPRRIKRDETVLAGMLPTSSATRLRVARKHADSALSRIMEMVEHAAERKAPTELFIRRFARVYTPAVTALALLIVALPYLWSLAFGTSYVFEEWLYRGLVFLVISCPCALVVSIPLGYFGGIGAASRLGILFKGGNYVDATAKITAMAFDKTGTLTEGAFAVAEVHCAADFDKKELIRLIATAESGSTHPIAKAIGAEAERLGLAVGQAENVDETAGYGLEAEAWGRTVLAGTAQLLERHGIHIGQRFDDNAATTVYCAVDGKYAGCFLLSDKAKPDAAETISQLRKEGVRTLAIFSGDRQAVVSHFGKQIGVDEAYGDLLPEDKVARFEQFKKQCGGVVAYAGDGINDAPVLAMSDVSFAMGGIGSDAAVETADVVIETDRPSRLADAVRIGKTTVKIVRQNIVLALGVKAIVLALGSAGFADLWAAVFADVGVALLAICNALRVQRAAK